MTLTELRYIIAVAQQKHFGRAAEICFVSQPTLSAAVKKLEEELGALIFERCTNDIKITPFGNQIIAQAQKIMAEVTVLKDMAVAQKDQLKGILRLGAIYTIGPYLFPKLIPLLHEKTPDMPIVVQEDFTENFRKKLLQGEVDVVILSLPFTECSINITPLYDESFLVLLPKGHPLEKKKIIKSNELKDENVLLLGQGHCFRDQILQTCPQCQTSFGKEQYLGSSLETLRYMVASGLGVTLLPATAVSTYPAVKNEVVYRPLEKPTPKRRVVLAWRKSFPRPKVIDVLHETILSCGLEDIVAI